jgi:hypothetical protein
MIEIVQRILDDMKDEPPPSAAVVSDARKRYQEKLDTGVWRRGQKRAAGHGIEILLCCWISVSREGMKTNENAPNILRVCQPP